MHRKFFAALMMFAIMLVSSVASATYEEEVQEGADLTKVKKIAIAIPNYYKTLDTEPELYDLMREIFNAGRLTSTRDVASYDDVAAAIRRDTGVDLRALDAPEAEKAYKKYISRYADSYLVVTIANNSKYPWLFFHLYNATDSELLYSFSIQSRLIAKTAADYGKSAEEYFKRLDSVTLMNLDKTERKAIEKRQKEVREKKRQLNKVNYTKKSKADLVKKK